MPKDSYEKAAINTLVKVASNCAAIGACGGTIWQVMQRLRTSNVSPDTKDLIATASSSVNMALDGAAFLDFLIVMFWSGAWRELSKKQLAIISVMAILALGGLGYAANRFGIEHNVGAATIAAACSSTLFNLASSTTKFCHEDIISPDEERVSLLRTNNYPG